MAPFINGKPFCPTDFSSELNELVWTMANHQTNTNHVSVYFNKLQRGRWHMAHRCDVSRDHFTIFTGPCEEHGTLPAGDCHHEGMNFQRPQCTANNQLPAIALARSWTIRTSSNSTRLLKIVGSKDQQLHMSLLEFHQAAKLAVFQV